MTLRFTKTHLILIGFLILFSSMMYTIERGAQGSSFWLTYVFAALVVLAYLRSYYIIRKKVFLTSFYQIYYYSGLLASAAIVSLGAFMIEIKSVGSANGTFWVVVCFLVISLEVTAVGFMLGSITLFENRVRRLSWGQSKTVILSLSGFALLASLFVLLMYGAPALRGVDRTTFWSTMVPGVLRFVPQMMSQSFFLVVFYFFWSRLFQSSRYFASIMIFAYIGITAFVLGQKFSGFVLYLNIWCMYLAAMHYDYKLDKRHLLVAVVGTCLIGLNVIYSYSDALFVVTRVALQSQLLWSVFEDQDPLLFIQDHWKCFFGCGSYRTGIDFISFRYLPSDVYHFYSENGTVLSGFMPALQILSFGFIATFFLNVFACFWLGFLQRKISISISEGNLLLSVLFFKIHLSSTMFWFVGMTSTVRGLLLTSALLLIVTVFLLGAPTAKRTVVSGRVHG